MATTDERYTVQDQDTGFLSAFANFRDACRYAELKVSLTRANEVTVFDRMARYGQAQLWKWDGRSFIEAQKRTRGPQCLRCSLQAVKLPLPKPYGEVEYYCSFICAAKDALDRPMSLCFEWCESHQQWDDGDGCELCAIGQRPVAK